VTGALTAGLLVAGGLGGPDNPLARPASAGLLLERAAQTVEQEKADRPKPHQWIYRKSTMRDDDGTTMTHETWLRADGRWAAQRSGGRLEKDRQHPRKDDASPLRDHDLLLKLPTDPQALLAWAYKTIDDRYLNPPGPRIGARPPRTEDGRRTSAFQELTGLFDDLLSPPRTRAAAFRALALIPGVVVETGRTDPLGRPTTMIARTNEHGLRYEELIDPVTAKHLAWGSVVVAVDPSPSHPVAAAGSGVGNGGPLSGVVYAPPPPIGRSHHEMVVASAIVDEAGRT
ncbi:CU044_5270 family protein, partial [Actinocorallia lasiicapitis]